MGTGSSLEILVWLVLILLALAILPFAIAILLQRQVQAHLKDISARLRQLQADVAAVRLATRPYAPSDPEPYGSLATALTKQIGDLEGQVRGFFGQYAQIRERMRQLASPNDFKLLMRLPFESYEAHKWAGELRRSLDRAGRGLESAYGLLTKLEKQGWEVAQQARRVLQDAQKAYQKLEALRARNLSDASLDGWIEAGREWERRFQTGVPIYFMSGSEADVLSQDDRQSVSEVFRLASDGRPAVDGLLAKAREWEGQVTALEKACEEMVSIFQGLSTEMRDLENSPVRPIVWDRSRKALSTAGQQVDMIAQLKKSRTLDGVKKDLSVSLSLLDQLKEMSKSCRETAAAHQELLALLGSAEIQSGQEWSRGALKVAEQIAGYDPENWARSEGAARLRADLQALSDQQARLTAPAAAGAPPGPTNNRPAALRETELETQLIEARRLAEMHADLRPRVASIQKRLGEIQAMERVARENAARARALLGQAESIVLSNPLLSKFVPEAKSARESLDSVTAQLDQPGKGAVEAKAQRVEGLLRKAGQAVNAWLAELNDDLDARMDALHERTSRLNAIALLDDPAMSEAQRLLASEDQDARRVGKPSRRTELPLADAVAELKIRSEAWQRCASILKAIESIEGSITDDFEKAEHFRQEAIEQLARAAELIPESRAWPPSNQNLATERQDYHKVEQQWKALAQERIQPIRLVSRLGTLAGEYQGLAARISQKVERAGQEQNRFRELENRLAESRSMWQNQMQIHADSAVTRDDIHLLLEEVEGETEAVKEHYRRGSIAYNQALQTLRQICQKLDDALVQLNATQDIDINGEIYVRQ
jgi:hypothetical protein